MDMFNTSEKIDQYRRRFFGTGAVTFAAAQLGLIGAADAQAKPKELSTIKPGTNTLSLL
jgi:hypothetical protein